METRHRALKHPSCPTAGCKWRWPYKHVWLHFKFASFGIQIMAEYPDMPPEHWKHCLHLGSVFMLFCSSYYFILSLRLTYHPPIAGPWINVLRETGPWCKKGWWPLLHYTVICPPFLEKPLSWSQGLILQYFADVLCNLGHQSKATSEKSWPQCK